MPDIADCSLFHNVIIGKVEVALLLQSHHIETLAATLAGLTFSEQKVNHLVKSSKGSMCMQSVHSRQQDVGCESPLLPL